MLSLKSRDDDQQSGDLDKGGQNILYGIGNTWNAASKHARIDSAQKTQPSGKANRAKSQVCRLYIVNRGYLTNNSLFGNKFPYLAF